MSVRRKSCRLPEGEPCQSIGKRGPCGHCHDTTANAERGRARHADPEFARRRSKWPDCPDHLWNEYRELQRLGLTATEARAAMENSP